MTYSEYKEARKDWFSDTDEIYNAMDHTLPVGAEFDFQGYHFIVTKKGELANPLKHRYFFEARSTCGKKMIWKAY